MNQSVSKSISIFAGNARNVFIAFAESGMKGDDSPAWPCQKKRRLDLPRFRGEMRAWDQALWLCVMLSSGFVAFFSSTPAELFFRPDPRTDGAAARSGGQGRPLAAAARRACP